MKCGFHPRPPLNRPVSGARLSKQGQAGGCRTEAFAPAPNASSAPFLLAQWWVLPQPLSERPPPQLPEGAVVVQNRPIVPQTEAGLSLLQRWILPGLPELPLHQPLPSCCPDLPKAWKEDWGRRGGTRDFRLTQAAWASPSGLVGCL